MVTSVTVAMGMRMTGVTVVIILIMGMGSHLAYSTRSMAAMQPFPPAYWAV